MTDKTTRTTGNDPVEGLDPGGARSTRPGNPDKSSDTKPAIDHHVQGGDRNTRTDEKLVPD